MKLDEISPVKFKNIMYTNRYRLNDEELEHVFKEKHLGVIIDCDLKFEQHMLIKVKKANAIVGLIRHSFSYLDSALFKKLFTMFVRLHLEYAQAVWSPPGIIENIQIRATKLVDTLGNLDYADRLRKLNLPTLVYRRKMGDMIEQYKHFHVYDKPTLSKSFQPKLHSTLRHDSQLIWHQPKDGIIGSQANSFYYRAAQLWNDLPNKVANTPNINVFKNILDKV